MASKNTDTKNTQTDNTNTADDHAEIQTTPEQAEQFRAAYESLADERAALAEDRLARINVDIPTAVNTVLGNLPSIQALADEAKGLPGFDMKTIDKLGVYAEALAFSQMLYNAASQPVEEVPGLAEELSNERQKLLASAEALATRGFLDPTRLRDLKGGTGYKNIAYDVGTLVAMMRAAWSKIEGKTAVTADELTNAQVQTEKLLLAVAAREQRDIDTAAAGEQRARAFTLLSNAYDQVRRAVTYLRWGQPVDDIVPSFYNGRASGRKQAAAAPAEQPPAAPAQPTNGAAQPAPAPGA